MTSTGNDTSDANNTTTITTKNEEESFFDQSSLRSVSQEKSKMTKDSILALYGTPSHQPTIYGVPGKVQNKNYID